MKNTTTSVPIDFFGVAASQHVRVLLTTDSNRRARKSAFNNMERLAKIAGLFPKNVVVTYVAVYIDLNGYQGIRYEYECRNEPAIAITGSNVHIDWGYGECNPAIPAEKAP